MKKIKLFMFFISLIFISSLKVDALSFPQNSDKFSANNNVNISGEVNGDIYSFGNNITINSNLAGDIIGAGNVINVTGKASGNIRMAGNNLTFNNINARNFTVAGSNILFSNTDANNIYAAGANIEFSGNANSINFSGAEVIINGTINGESSITAEKVTITDKAVINSTLNIKSVNEIKYQGTVNKENIVYSKIKDMDIKENRNVVSFIPSLVYKILATYLLALIIMFLFSNFVDKSIKNIKDKKVSTILYGLGLLIIIPILSVLAMITVIGIPVIVITMFAYITLLIITSAFGSLALGNILFNDMNKYLKIFLAVLIISVISIIPIINAISWLILVGYTFGSISLLFKKK